MLKSIIVEDEPLAAVLLERYIRKYPNLTNLGSFRNAVEAKHFLDDNTIDLIFLDLHLPQVRGFDFLDSLNEKYYIILTTAYSEYALEGFEKGVIDYLLKPVLYPRFEQALNRLNELISTKSNHEKSINIQVNKTKMKLYEKDITHIESNKGYVNVFDKERNIFRTKLSTHAILEMLSGDFIRIHKSFIINKKHAISLSSSSLELKGGTSLPIGRKYKPNVIDQITLDS